MTLTVAAVRPAPPFSPAPAEPHASPAVDYERVLHQLVRREFTLLADLASWAPPDDRRRALELTRHAELLVRLLIRHHDVERDALWPALFGHLPAEEREAARDAVVDWTSRTAALDRLLRAQGTAGRQWALTLAERARQAFALVCADAARAVQAHIAVEEERLLPLLGPHLPHQEWTAIRRHAHSPLRHGERLFVLGLALEDSCAADRRRLLAGQSAAERALWRLVGRRRYRAAIVRLRGAAPAA